MESTIIVVTGGARSGKSVFAEEYVKGCAGKVAYVATAQALDDEMVLRIKAHQKRRPPTWETREIPYGLSAELPELLTVFDVVLVDCLTLYFSNFLFQYEHEGDEVILNKALDEMTAICDEIHRTSGKTVVLVTNELGCGIVPMGRISRLYRDIIGSINQLAARRANEVYMTVCGIPIEIKRNSVGLGESK